MPGNYNVCPTYVYSVKFERAFTASPVRQDIYIILFCEICKTWITGLLCFFTGVYSVQDLPSLLLSLVLISFSKHHNNNVKVQYKVFSAKDVSKGLGGKVWTIFCSNKAAI